MINWRFLLGEFFAIVVGVLMALWVDQVRAARADAKLEVAYLESFLVDLDADQVAAGETTGWQYVPCITRNRIDDLRSTANLRLIRDPELRWAIAAYYATVEINSVPIAAMRDRMWNQYDARAAGPGATCTIASAARGGSS